MKHFPDSNELRRITDQVLTVLTDTRFLEQMQAVNSAPPNRRLAEASKRLTPKALSEIGIRIPENVRLSSRYFDDQANAEVELADVQGGLNIVNALNETRPGFLDDLKLQRPDLFRRIVEQDVEKTTASLRSSGGCLCGGISGMCIGGGV